MNALDEDSPFGDLYHRRVKKNQDIVVVVSDYHNRRGTGKTILSLKLAAEMDRTDEGIISGKCTLSPEKLTQAYTEQPPGSALVLDEAEAGLSKYEAGTNVNKAVRRLISMGRIEEKYVVLNLPASAELDRDLKALCDVWCLVQRRGAALVHFLEYNPYGEHPITRKQQQIEWSDIPKGTDERAIYNRLAREKRKRLDGDEGDFVKAEEVEKAAERAEKQARMDQRDEFIHELRDTTGMTQEEIGDVVGLSRSRIAKILGGA